MADAAVPDLSVMHFFARKHWFCGPSRVLAWYPMLVSANTTVNLAFALASGSLDGIAIARINK